MIRRRIDTTTTKTGNERWLVSYSDLVTLLFAFFVVMYSVSHVNSEKYRALSSTLKQTFHGEVPVDAELKTQLDRIAAGQDGPAPTAQNTPSDPQALAELLQSRLAGNLAAADMSISASEDWVEIDLNANLLFASGSAQPSEKAQQIFADAANTLAALPNAVEVAGHTDSRPIETPQFASNWELSAARASAAVRLLAQGGVQPERLAAVGFGEFRPVADNSTSDGRAQNRRVVVKVARYTGPVAAPVTLETVAPSPANAEAETAEQTPTPATAEDSSNPEQNSEPVQDIAPVRLNNGNLLFSSDPEERR